MAQSRWCALIFVVASIALAAGCKPKVGSGPNPGPATGNSGPGPQGAMAGGVEAKGPHAAGINVFNSHCKNCHPVGDAWTGGGRKMKGPDLAKVAAEPEHTEDWLREFIQDPKSKKPDTKGMPSFRGKLGDDDLNNLIAYLATLK